MSHRYASRDEAIDAAAEVLAAGDLAAAQMTPRELAEAAWRPESPYTVDELEQQIRDERQQDQQPLAG